MTATYALADSKHDQLFEMPSMLTATNSLQYGLDYAAGTLPALPCPASIRFLLVAIIVCDRAQGRELLRTLVGQFLDVARTERPASKPKVNCGQSTDAKPDIRLDRARVLASNSVPACIQVR